MKASNERTRVWRFGRCRHADARRASTDHRAVVPTSQWFGTDAPESPTHIARPHASPSRSRRARVYPARFECEESISNDTNLEGLCLPELQARFRNAYGEIQQRLYGGEPPGAAGSFPAAQ